MNLFNIQKTKDSKERLFITTWTHTSCVYVMIDKRSFESFMCLDLSETLKESEFSLGLKLYCFSLQRPKQQQQQKRIVNQMHVQTVCSCA